MECELVTFGDQARVVREPGGLRIRVLRSSARMRGHPVHSISFDLPGAVKNADLVHAHHMRSAPSRIVAVTARARRQRLAVTDHGLGGGGWGGLLPRLFDRFLLVSRFSALTLGVPDARTRVIYGGADPARFRPDPDVDRVGVLYVGRLTPHKGIDRLIRALPKRARLTIAGTGGHDPEPPERDYPLLLAQLAADKDVEFTGAVAEDELPGLYRRAAVVVLPSVQETCYGKHVEISELLGLSLLEAMASGTPVVCSRLGGLTEVVNDGETGFLVQPGSVEELHDRISVVLSNPALAARMGAAARELVLERFTWDRCALRCLSAYEELMGPG